MHSADDVDFVTYMKKRPCCFATQGKMVWWMAYFLGKGFWILLLPTCGGRGLCSSTRDPDGGRSEGVCRKWFFSYGECDELFRV